VSTWELQLQKKEESKKMKGGKNESKSQGRKHCWSISVGHDADQDTNVRRPRWRGQQEGAGTMPSGKGERKLQNVIGEVALRLGRARRASGQN